MADEGILSIAGRESVEVRNVLTASIQRSSVATEVQKRHPSSYKRCNVSNAPLADTMAQEGWLASPEGDHGDTVIPVFNCINSDFGKLRTMFYQGMVANEGIYISLLRHGLNLLVNLVEGLVYRFGVREVLLESEVRLSGELIM
ncbi:hypothetical protein RHGRI_025551 [Rhododendron griersonianum]|uniref:Uncharacterized protein n=1 Tax=Rhododendron griersonianum TaxID=479676 RepID=A0AAV6ISX4_9ERIC|nr:hypothetical protein RHGRI_025551 [Rhododendron griersonianum]